MTGFRSDVRRLMKAFDVFCLTSDSEGMPNVVLEAMAAGPAIAEKAMQAARDGKSELLQKMMEDNGMAVFTARIEHHGETVASCQLNVYVPTEKKLQEMKIRSQS